ncbi:hypothetical protein EW026_g2963 [Hermanssonia centrifuga]|uniref:Uncharacterized protein n=1 Tax=Hermanssonia centrifuga TaxID=98765 RepID=A0A4S4KMN2_9APHY|nr:hypothetical protein EW026_g2963 [Hermanssonia centrifuga]
MIILDEVEDVPKLASPPPIHSDLSRLTRAVTTTPSLPDYETSQEQHRSDAWKPKPLSRRWRWAIYGLIAYFVVTIAIGVPLIILKSRKSSKTYKSPSLLYPAPAAYGSNINNSLSGLDLGIGPYNVDAATACDIWSFKDRQQGNLMHAQLEYYVPTENTVFVQSNVSYSASNNPSYINGRLNVDISDDPKDTNVSIKVAMSYSGTDIRQQTSVCLMNLDGADGLYLYVPYNLDYPDQLNFNVTVLFPQQDGPIPVYICNFITSLPYFAQHIGNLSPGVSFGTVVLEGSNSSVTVEVGIFRKSINDVFTYRGLSSLSKQNL